MRIIAIDPGCTQSAFAVMVLCTDGDIVLEDFDTVPNEQMFARIDDSGYELAVFEKVACMGMAVGAEVFETVYWTGRFAEHVISSRFHVDRIERKAVKLNLCGTHRAKDPNIRAAVIDRFGGVQATKKGGELYRVSKDVWAAIAVGLTWIDQQKMAARKTA